MLSLNLEKVSNFPYVLGILYKWHADIVSAPRLGVDAVVNVDDISSSDHIEIKSLSHIWYVWKLEGSIWLHDSVELNFTYNNFLFWFELFFNYFARTGPSSGTNIFNAMLMHEVRCRFETLLYFLVLMLCKLFSTNLQGLHLFKRRTFAFIMRKNKFRN